MTEPRTQVLADIGPPSDPDALPEEIEAFGAGTADAVATELDVNTQASRLAGLQDTATTTYRSRPPATWAVVAVVAVVTIVTWALSRRRNR